MTRIDSRSASRLVVTIGTIVPCRQPHNPGHVLHTWHCRELRKHLIELLHRAMRILFGMRRGIRIHHQQLARLIPHVACHQSRHGVQQQSRAHGKYKRCSHFRNHEAVTKHRCAVPGHATRCIVLQRLCGINLRCPQRRKH